MSVLEKIKKNQIDTIYERCHSIQSAQIWIFISHRQDTFVCKFLKSKFIVDGSLYVLFKELQFWIVCQSLWVLHISEIVWIWNQTINTSVQGLIPCQHLFAFICKSFKFIIIWKEFMSWTLFCSHLNEKFQ